MRKNMDTAIIRALCTVIGAIMYVGVLIIPIGLVQGRIVEVSNVDLFFLLLSVVENRFNNSVFLTKSEAEAKLKELRGGEDER